MSAKREGCREPSADIFAPQGVMGGGAIFPLMFCDGHRSRLKIVLSFPDRKWTRAKGQQPPDSPLTLKPPFT